MDCTKRASTASLCLATMIAAVSMPAAADDAAELGDLKEFWRSDYYGAQAKAVLSRPAFVIDQPTSSAAIEHE